jgi:hypothetical protein
MAAVQMLENSLGEADRERRMLSISPDDLDQAAKLAPRFDFSPGYQDRVLYLMWLHSKMNIGITFNKPPITADEADGIDAVLRGRQIFEAEHPRCAGCGTRLSFKSMKRCPSCRTELK